MRIIAGRFKGRRLRPVDDENVRSTADRVKESLFNILMHDTPHSLVLDLFCGAGSLGLEALSRGAESAVFVDSSPRSLKQTAENANSLGLEGVFKTMRADAVSALASLATREARFNLIFADPPYGQGWPSKMLTAIANSSIRANEGVLVIEHHKKDEPGDAPPGFSVWTTRRFGDTVLSFWRWHEGD